MPKSKRDKKVSLTQTTKKGLVLKQKIIEDVRTCSEKYERIFTFTVSNMRNIHMKDVRQKWSDSRFFFGKNKVMVLALGRSPDDEHLDGLHHVSAHLHGETGLLFTNKSQAEVIRFFSSYHVADYARSGNIARETVVLKEGPLPDFQHTMEPQLRQLGLPTSLKRGMVTLLCDHTVCTKGEVLSPEKARMLKLLGYTMANFSLTMTGMWMKDGSWQDLSGQAAVSKKKLARNGRRKKSDTSRSQEEAMDMESSGHLHDHNSDHGENSLDDSDT